MQNWYCLVNFPDDTDGVHLVPGPAPVKGAIIKMLGQEGLWFVVDIHVREHLVNNTAAEIWVRPPTDDELTSASLS